MDMWICLDETGPVSVCRDSGWSSRFRQACKAGSIPGETADKEKVERKEEAELNGVEEERDEMSDGEGDEKDGEEELAAPDWQQTDTKGERGARSNTRGRSETGAHTA